MAKRIKKKKAIHQSPRRRQAPAPQQAETQDAPLASEAPEQAAAVAAPPTVVEESSAENEAASSTLSSELQDVKDSLDSDAFTRLSARIVSGAQENGAALISVALLVLAAYGISRYSAYAERGEQAKAQAEASQALKVLEDALAEETVYRRALAKWYEENPEPVSSPSVQAPDGSALQRAAETLDAVGNRYNSGVAQLASLAAASAELRLIQQSGEKIERLTEIAATFGEVAADQGVDTFTRAIAAQNRAVSFEEAALRAEGEAATESWVSAAEAWAALGELDAEIYGLHAGINQARSLRAAGKPTDARAIYEGLNTRFEEALKAKDNQPYKQAIDSGLARCNQGA
ncbi:MAG: hypothetical protein VYD19_09305 [Myxococcota bacterium]|nr:hypothetical protein [Myxococcota bacterium]